MSCLPELFFDRVSPGGWAPPRHESVRNTWGKRNCSHIFYQSSLFLYPLVCYYSCLYSDEADDRLCSLVTSFYGHPARMYGRAVALVFSRLNMICCFQVHLQEKTFVLSRKLKFVLKSFAIRDYWNNRLPFQKVSRKSDFPEGKCPQSRHHHWREEQPSFVSFVILGPWSTGHSLLMRRGRRKYCFHGMFCKLPAFMVRSAFFCRGNLWIFFFPHEEFILSHVHLSKKWTLFIVMRSHSKKLWHMVSQHYIYSSHPHYRGWTCQHFLV